MEFDATTESWEVIGLLNRYALAYDEKDIERLRTCYTDDAAFTIQIPSNPSREHRGLEAILDNARRTFQAVDWPRRHIITNHVIRAKEAQLLEATCYLQLIDTLDGEVRVTLTGTYVDSLTRTAEGWRIRHRTLKADSAFQIQRRESIR